MTKDQEKHLADIISTVSVRLIKKYKKGQKEHGGNMWLKQGMFRHLENEMLDSVSYYYTLDYQLRMCLQALKKGDIITAIKLLENILKTPKEK